MKEPGGLSPSGLRFFYRGDGLGPILPRQEVLGYWGSPPVEPHKYVNGPPPSLERDFPGSSSVTFSPPGSISPVSVLTSPGRRRGPPVLMIPHPPRGCCEELFLEI